MKKNKEFPYLALAFLVLWCPVFMGAWNKDKPSSSTSLRNSNPEMLANQSALETSFGAHHEFSTGGTNSGDNLRIKFNAPISTPTNAANKLFIYGKDVSSVIEAHILDESGNELQITSGGDLFSSAGLTVTSASTFNGSITLGAGDDLIGSSTSDITFNTNKFTVAGATGNTVVGGTFDVTGNIDPTTYETTNGGFLDEDAMGSNSANKVVSQQSLVAYIATQIAGDNPTANDSESNAMLKDHAYLTQGPGFVNASLGAGNADVLKVYVHTTNDPAGAGTLMDNQRSDGGSGFGGVFTFVASGKYFEVTHASATPTINWTPLVASGAAPIDQD